MTGELWLGLDLGTTGVRCVAFDESLSVQASSYRECPPDFFPGGRVEQAAEAWLDSSVEVIASALAEVDRSLVRGLSISSQGITLVPVDAAGEPLRAAISWLDHRGEEMLPALARLWPPDELVARTGKPWSGAYPLAKVLWLERSEAELMERCARLLLPMDYLLLRMTGRAVTDHTMAAGTMYYRNDTREWDDEILRRAGIPRSRLPEILPAGTAVGPLTPTMSARLGLGADVQIRVGGQDQKCAALAAGLAPGVATLSLGTAAALETLHHEPTSLPGVPTFSYLFEGRWVREGVVETAGAAHRWFAQATGRAREYRELEQAATATYPDRDQPLFFPHLGRMGIASDAARWGSAPAGVFWGLTLDTGMGDLARAVLEGVAFEVQLLRSQLATDGVTSLRVFGGGALSDLWCRILADVTQLRVEVLRTHEAAAAGAAMLAGAPGRLPVARTYLPEPDASLLIGERLIRYRQVRDRLYG